MKPEIKTETRQKEKKLEWIKLSTTRNSLNYLFAISMRERFRSFVTNEKQKEMWTGCTFLGFYHRIVFASVHVRFLFKCPWNVFWLNKLKTDYLWRSYSTMAFLQDNFQQTCSRVENCWNCHSFFCWKFSNWLPKTYRCYLLKFLDDVKGGNSIFLTKLRFSLFVKMKP